MTDQDRNTKKTLKRRDRRGQENLDARITLVPRAYVFAFLCLLVVALVIGVWGVYGTIPTKALGNGLIVRSNQQVTPIQSTGEGRVRKITVVAGQSIDAGTVLAELDQIDLDSQIKTAREAVTDLAASLNRLKVRQDSELARHKKSTSQTVRLISASIAELTKGRDGLAKLLVGEESLLKRGLINRSKELDSRVAYQNIVSQIGELRIKQANVRQALADQIGSAAGKADEAQEKVNLERRKLERLISLRNAEKLIRATIGGRVEEIRAAVGQNVSRTDVLMTVVHGGSGAEVIAFLDPRQARRVVIGMPVHVIPSSIDKAEFGSIQGKVSLVSPEPVSQANAKNLFQNSQLAAQLASTGEMYLARIKLAEDTGSANGFKWWFGSGPKFKIKPGTFASVEIVVREQAPVELVVPAMRSILGD